MYWVFMGVAVPALAIGWLAYWLYMRKVREEEKKRPKQVSKRLDKTRNEISDWAKKMAAYEPPKRKFPKQEESQSPEK